MKVLGLISAILGYVAFVVSLAGVRRHSGSGWSAFTRAVKRRRNAVTSGYRVKRAAAGRWTLQHGRHLRNWVSTQLKRVGFGDGGQIISAEITDPVSVHDPVVESLGQVPPTPMSNLERIGQLEDSIRAKLEAKSREQAKEENVSTWWGLAGFALGVLGTLLLALA